MASHDVAIIGLGPVGCSAAIMFAASGLRVLVIEQSTAVYPLPRAVAMDGEVLRGFQRFGLGNAIHDLLQAPRPGSRIGFANAQREWLFGQDLPEFGANGWPPMSVFDQPELEQHLRSLALSQDRVTAYEGHRVIDITNRKDGVVVTAVNDAEEPVTLSARYALACDGAASFVRRQLGIGWNDLGYDHEWLVVDVVIKDGHTLGTDSLQVCDPERIATYICTKDPYRRWEFKLNPGESREEMLEEETVHRLLESWTPRGSYELRRTAVYQFHAATAQRWREGRIFLAGDAAHQTPPFLGQGMNAGIRDVINLSWKLPLVIDGTADEDLLDSYFDEREAHAHDLVDWAVAVGQLMDHLTEVERALQEGRPPPGEPRPLRSSAYGQGREQPPLRAGALMLDQVSDTGSTGYLFNQPIVRDAKDSEFRLDRLLGSRFAVVGRSSDVLRLSPASRATLDALGATLVPLNGLETVRGHFDRLFETGDAAVVRPDRIVFGHTTADLSLDQLIAQLGTKLHLRPGEQASAAADATGPQS